MISPMIETQHPPIASIRHRARRVKRLFYRLGIALLLGSITPLNSHADNLIISPSADHAIIQAIEQAKKSIDIVMYGFTRHDITQALIHAQQRGVIIRLLLEPHPYRAKQENNWVKKKLLPHSISIKEASPAFQFTHQKSMLIDHSTAYIMTGNFTYSSQYRQRNLTLITHNAEAIKDINQTFENDWHRRPTLTHATSLIWSPYHAESRLIDLIQQAHTRIDCANQSLSDPDILQALAKQADAGINVQLLLPATTLPQHQRALQRLKQHHASIHLLSHPYLHEKLLIIDGHSSSAVALVGSMNFTTTALTKNRELGMVIHTPALVQKTVQLFQTDWKSSRSF